MMRAGRPERAASGARLRFDASLSSRPDDAYHRPHDADIAGAAAQVAAKPQPDVPLAGLGEPQDEVARRDQHAGGTEAALQRMLAGERGAQLGGDLVVVEALDGGDARALAGERIGDAGARGNAVEQQRAGAAHP